MITLNNITKNYGTLTAVNDISLSVNEGEIFGLVGPDGAGKTTIIRMLTGLLSPTSGSLTVLGAANPESVKDHLGYVPQKFSLYGDLTVMENIRVFGSLCGQSEEQIDDLATHILDFTKILPFKDRLADNLSGGMKQKLALAAGLMHQPQLFFLDEPTTGVDPVSRRDFWRMLFKLNKEGTTIFVSTPYMDEAELCTRIAFLHNGRIVSCDSPQGLRRTYPYKVLELKTNDRNIKEHLAPCPLLDINMFGEAYHLVVEDMAAAVQIKSALAAANIAVAELEEIQPTLEDVFVALASEVA
ncbi:MAG TPA: ABC transporter ATP-binding protein [Methylomusa anaerophila]|uniref:Putative ABC transporter ATP-binding protein YbhF n=1 Tax=Methylomusa anaerophila TaxID=1930071 RepID=A0A348AIR0_9FIRM|nr:ABC transporter ATP-binding protein [Methylomusa anaerophila]BBB90958.1 putative ABC transporter ATP-binding protein YbhF [Methylomusa anaerophila]HML90415.1 ABC transporter ATP-binding protein [Methylomusa anaerophila]